MVDSILERFDSLDLGCPPCTPLFYPQSLRERLDAGATVYVVSRGRCPGVYPSWTECERQIIHFNNPRYVKKSSWDELIEWWMYDCVPGFHGHPAHRPSHEQAVPRTSPRRSTELPQGSYSPGRYTQSPLRYPTLQSRTNYSSQSQGQGGLGHGYGNTTRSSSFGSPRRSAICYGLKTSSSMTKVFSNFDDAEEAMSKMRDKGEAPVLSISSSLNEVLDDLQESA